MVDTSRNHLHQRGGTRPKDTSDNVTAEAGSNPRGARISKASKLVELRPLRHCREVGAKCSYIIHKIVQVYRD